jgi:hypothetical protein
MLAYIYVVALHSFAGSFTMVKEATARGGHSLTDEKTKSKALMAERWCHSAPCSMLSPLLAWLLAVESL